MRPWDAQFWSEAPGQHAKSRYESCPRSYIPERELAASCDFPDDSVEGSKQAQKTAPRTVRRCRELPMMTRGCFAGRSRLYDRVPGHVGRGSACNSAEAQL